MICITNMPHVLDAASVEDGVKNVLVNDYQVPDVDSVQCPSYPEVKAGNKFTCTVQLGSDHLVEKVVDITVMTDDGQYQVDTPKDK